MNMFKISSRTRLTIVAFATAILYAVLIQIDFNEIFKVETLGQIDYFKALILGVFLYIATAWALFFKIKGERFLTVLLFPALGTMALSLLVELIVMSLISGEVGQPAVIIGSSIIIGLFAYINLLTVNILNASYLANIPLAQAARAAMFILALVDAYLVFFMAYSNDIFIIARIALLGITTGILIFITLWSIQLRIKDRIFVTLGVALVVAFIGGVLSMWPLQAQYLALILSLFFYVFLNIAMEVREMIGKFIWIEYLILFGLIGVLLITLSEWGINGPLL